MHTRCIVAKGDHFTSAVKRCCCLGHIFGKLSKLMHTKIPGAGVAPRLAGAFGINLSLTVFGGHIVLAMSCFGDGDSSLVVPMGVSSMCNSGCVCHGVKGIIGRNFRVKTRVKLVRGHSFG